MDLDYLARLKEHDYTRILKVSHIQVNAKLGQLDKQQTGMVGVPSSILTGVVLDPAFPGLRRGGGGWAAVGGTRMRPTDFV